MLLCLLPPACACQNIGYIQETYAAQAWKPNLYNMKSYIVCCTRILKRCNKIILSPSKFEVQKT
jgi:hypothetical protein